jgi:hypothetical protein
MLNMNNTIYPCFGPEINELDTSQKIIKNEDCFIFNCPHCLDTIIVHEKELNCQIFRHAVYKDNYIQVDPHLNKNDCDKLLLENKVYGCCKPFEIIKDDNNNLIVIKCEYK